MLELNEYTDTAKDKLRAELRGLSKKEMIVKIQKMGLSDTSLIFLCEIIALETEDYEICDAVQYVRNNTSVFISN